MQTWCFAKLLSDHNVYLFHYLSQLCFHLDQSDNKPPVRQALSSVCIENQIWHGASNACLYMNGVAKLQSLSSSLKFSSL